MAKKTFQQIDFVTGRVDGTLAYDFDVPAYYPEETEAPVRAPKRRRVPGTRGRDWVREDAVSEELVRTQADAGRLSAALRVMAGAGTVVAVVLVVLVLLAKIQMLGISAQTQKYERQISELEYQQSNLSLQYEQVFNLKDVEEIATGMLGMQEPREDQIYYLSGVSSADKAVVITHDEVGLSSMGFEDIFGSAKSYIDRIVSH